MKTSQHKPRKKPRNELFKAIGKVVVGFNEIEFGIRSAISEITWKSPLRDENVFMKTLCLTSGDSTRVLLSKLDNIVNHMIKDGIILKEFSKLRKDLVEIIDKRNRYVHSYWFVALEDRILRIRFLKKINAAKKMCEEEVSFDVGDMIQFIDNVESVRDRLFEFDFGGYSKIESIDKDTA